MQQTEHYGLNQWDPEDRILREDFNADNAKIEAALASKMGSLEWVHTIPGRQPPATIASSNPSLRLFDWPKLKYAVLMQEPAPGIHGDGNPVDCTLLPGRYAIGTVPGEEPFAVIFYVDYDASRTVKGLLLCSKPQFFTCDATYAELGSICFSVETGGMPSMSYSFWVIQ